jgi:hypothetical protein
LRSDNTILIRLEGNRGREQKSILAKRSAGIDHHLPADYEAFERLIVDRRIPFV